MGNKGALGNLEIYSYFLSGNVAQHHIYVIRDFGYHIEREVDVLLRPFSELPFWLYTLADFEGPLHGFKSYAGDRADIEFHFLGKRAKNETHIGASINQGEI